MRNMKINTEILATIYILDWLEVFYSRDFSSLITVKEILAHLKLAFFPASFKWEISRRNNLDINYHLFLELALPAFQNKYVCRSPTGGAGTICPVFGRKNGSLYPDPFSPWSTLHMHWFLVRLPLLLTEIAFFPGSVHQLCYSINSVSSESPFHSCTSLPIPLSFTLP